MSIQLSDQSRLNQFVCSLGYTEPIEFGKQVRYGILASLAAVGIYFFAEAADGPGPMGLFWVFGLAFGFVLQRSRFCFASAFRDIFLLQHGRNMKGVLVGLAVATLGFAVFMSRQVPNTALPTVPPDANILPIGLHTILGGLFFGVGMVIAGGCVSGSIYRMGEGYVASWVSFGGILIGILAAAFTWNWWWEFSIADGARIWFPQTFGHGGAVVLTLLGLLIAYLALVWWESRGGMVLPDTPFKANEEGTFAATINNNLRRIFVVGWPAAIGGVALGLLNILSFIAERPWGFTGELSRWVIGLTNEVGVGPGELLGANLLPGCTLEQGGDGFWHFMFFLVAGMIFGSFIAALFAGEFKLRFPKQSRRYWQATGGGIVMGYGAGIAMGCTIGGFFSAIPSLALNGWVFALFLALGAFIGVRLLRYL